MSAKIAVVIPTYNRTWSLVRAVESVMAQTLRPSEILVVDDGSEWPASKTLEAFPQVRILVNDTNRGASFSRNRGAFEADSKMIAFLDSDDYWAPGKLKAQHAVFVDRPEVELVYCDQYVVLPDGRELPSGKILIDADILDRLLDFWTAPNTSTLMIRKATFRRLGGFDDQLLACNDHDLWMRIATQGIKVGYVDNPLSYFCFDQSNRLTFNYRSRMPSIEQFLAKWRHTIEQEKGKADFYRFRNRYYFQGAFPIFLRLLKAGQIEAVIIFAQYLAANPQFYQMVLRRLGLRAHRWLP